ncbi:hypothetical protein DL764_001886 [Monosporascus ibericus]|uniref:Uncharacterized protein n=1 Tax=Monosporascus ibericus TaxID=155417 RepID=A0A4Q4TS72_9PEZI|nr:hypothetical protein DL764_001886 [Monosporascus ibericus]
MSQQQEPSSGRYSFGTPSNEWGPEYDIYESYPSHDSGTEPLFAPGLDNPNIPDGFYLSQADGEGEIDAFYGYDFPNQNITGDRGNATPAQDRRQGGDPRRQPPASDGWTRPLSMENIGTEGISHRTMAEVMQSPLQTIPNTQRSSAETEKNA